MAETRFFHGRPGISLKKKAVNLRQNGRTHREVAKELEIAVGTAYEWTKGISLSENQKHAVAVRVAARRWTPERRAAQREILMINLASYRAANTYSRECLLEKIRGFYKKNGRIPMKREFNIHRPYQREFGSWNHAIRLAGFTPNPELFAHKFRSGDGHSCDSFTEKIIDDWLSRHQVAHERNWAYEGTKMTADFLIGPDTVLEFFGLAGVQARYDEIISRKREFCNRSGLRLIEIYPQDMFPVNRLAEKLTCF